MWSVDVCTTTVGPIVLTQCALKVWQFSALNLDIFEKVLDDAEDIHENDSDDADEIFVKDSNDAKDILKETNMIFFGKNLWE